MGKLQIQDVDYLNKIEKDIVPIIFTNKQINILKKRIMNKKLNVNERINLYRSINKKIKAIELLSNQKNEFVYGKEEIIYDRLNQGKKILNKFFRNHKSTKIILSGSYLWNKKYNDIDLFIISKYKKKDFKKNKLHVNYILEEDMDTIFFSSIMKISITNFNYLKKKKFKLDIFDLISIYQELIIYLLKKEDYKEELRNFILYSTYLSSNVILNSKQINLLFEKIDNSKNKIEIIQKIMTKTFLLNDDWNIKDIKDMIKTNDELYKKYKSKNLTIYNKLLTQVIKYG